MPSPVPELLALSMAAVVVSWLVGFAILRVLAARAAVKADRGEFFELMRDFGWMLEKARPWSTLGRVSLVWLFAIPSLLVLAVCLAFCCGHR